MKNSSSMTGKYFFYHRIIERLFFVRTLWLYLIIMKFLCFFFSLLEELANGLILVFFFTNSFLSVFPA
uniref:Uncharacterized protein n=1 Tax=Accipiter nisus TaxID=211598 RepID=A0A8B9NKK7_9AVES